MPPEPGLLADSVGATRSLPRSGALRTAASGDLPLMVGRALALIALVFGGLVLAVVIRVCDRLRVGARIPRERIAQVWNRALLRVLNVRVEIRGRPLAAPHLLVANHVSWLDIPVIGACVPARFVSRHDVQAWPVAGMLADACGTLYVHRGSGQSHVTAASMREQFTRGSVALFPEGTTSDGLGVLPFRARLFQPALDAGVPVQPVSLRYAPAHDGTRIAPFIGDDDLLSHLLRVLRQGRIDVEVSFFGALVADAHTERSALAAQAQRRIEQSIRRRGP